MLHKAHDGRLDAICDVVQADGFYDDRRIRVHSPDLDRVYELLYPRDERTLTPEVLAITGRLGLAALWCDTGTASKTRVVLRSWANSAETEHLYDWVMHFGYRPDTVRAGRLEFCGIHADAIIHDLRPLLPRCKRHSLRR